MEYIVLWKDNEYTIIIQLTNTIQHLWTGATGSITESSFIPLMGAALSKKKKKNVVMAQGRWGSLPNRQNRIQRVTHFKILEMFSGNLRFFRMKEWFKNYKAPLSNMPDDFHSPVFWEPVFQSVLKPSIVYIDLLLLITFPVL